MSDQLSPFLFVFSVLFVLVGAIALIFKGFCSGLPFFAFGILFLIILIDWKIEYNSYKFLTERINDCLKELKRIRKIKRKKEQK